MDTACHKGRNGKVGGGEGRECRGEAERRINNTNDI